MTSFQGPSMVAGQKGALGYHSLPTIGKYTTVPSKSLKTFLDLSLAYTPFVAKVCQEIAQEPQEQQHEKSKAYNLNPVAVISNGTAVLGLGDIGAHGSKPVMEGKAVLFQTLAHLPCIDIEIQEKNPENFISIVKSLSPSFGAINLEDIKAPECFVIENALQDLGIPVFHDDQHGTAIVVVAALLNALLLTGRTIDTLKTVVAGAGAGAIACLHLLESFGLKRENIFVCDSKGLIRKNREDFQHLSPEKEYYAQDSQKTTLEESLEGADFFLGLSSGGKSLPASWITKMNPKAIVFALANPTPEFWPQEVLALRSDVLISTGRSDFPNQVNNAICFPYLFRGALDAGVKRITLAMKKACALALAEVAREGYGDWEETWAFASNEGISLLHGLRAKDKAEDKTFQPSSSEDIQNIMDNIPLWMDFGPSYFMPKVFDPRLLWRIPEAVFRGAQSCRESGADMTRICPNYHELSFQDYPFLRFARLKCSEGSENKNNTDNTIVVGCSEESYENPWVFQRLESLKGFFRSQGFTFVVQKEKEGAHGYIEDTERARRGNHHHYDKVALIRKISEEKIHGETYGDFSTLCLLTTKENLGFHHGELYQALYQHHPSSVFPRIFSNSQTDVISLDVMDSLENLGQLWNHSLCFYQGCFVMNLKEYKNLKQWIEGLSLSFVLKLLSQ